MVACDGNDVAIATDLLAHNANPNIPSPDGSFPLHIACKRSHHDLIMLYRCMNIHRQFHNTIDLCPLQSMHAPLLAGTK